MYINYEKIGNCLGFGKEFFYNLKLKQNLNYIKKNQNEVLKKLKNKTPLNVVFYVYDEAKWKSQSVYDFMVKDERFNPKIVVTKNSSSAGNPNYQTIDDVKKCYDFFKTKGMNVEFGYDIQKDKFIPFEKFSPDLIFYSHPWYVYKTQGPVVCSKFALTYYIPYFIPASVVWFDYDLRFHKYLYKHYVSTDMIKNIYDENIKDSVCKLVTAGHPIFDEYLTSNDREKKYLIYAPHWTVCGDNLRFGTFEWSGKKVLEFAKSHPELNWVFRPHPLFYKFILTSGFMPHEDIDNYFDEWRKIGQISEGGDYVDLFKESYAMITDCGSFLTEYFITGNPVIHLISDKLQPNKIVEEIDKTYYKAHNEQELTKYLEEVLLNKNDTNQQARAELSDKLNLKNNYSAKRIIDDIINDIGVCNDKR